MTVTGIRHGLPLMCVFLGGQLGTKHFSKTLVMDRWAYGSDSFGEDIRYRLPFESWLSQVDRGPSLAGQSRSRQAHPGESGSCLLTLLPHPQLHPHRSSAGLLPSTTFVHVSFLPKMTSRFCSPEIWSSHSRGVIPPPPGVALIAPLTCR